VVDHDEIAGAQRTIGRCKAPADYMRKTVVHRMCNRFFATLWSQREVTYGSA
jgi:hypothetical protein